MHIIEDDKLELLFKNKIVQLNNMNRNSELFIYNDIVLKIYIDYSKKTKYNLKNVKELIKNHKCLTSIKELVLPIDLLKYNNDIVGFSMPYIKGITLDEIIKKDLLSTDEITLIFIKIKDLLDKINKSSINFFIGDLHEKNIIIDSYYDINIIDCDSFVINNRKLTIDKHILIGKYPNHYYSNEELKHINKSSDYLSLLCIILNYTFKDEIDVFDPISYIKDNKELKYILERLNNPYNFYLNENDIKNIIKLKDKAFLTDNQELTRELRRIRKN